MKTTKIRLIAMMITLAAAITILAIPAEAQRRSGDNDRRRRTVAPRTKNVSTKQNTKARKINTPTRRNYNSTSRKAIKTWDNKRPSERRVANTTKKSPYQRNKAVNRTDRQVSRNNVSQKPNTRTYRHDPKTSTRSKKNYTHNNRYNRLKERDIRYRYEDRRTPSKNYRGSNKYWSHKNRNSKHAYKHKYNRHHKYWDHRWQHYKWNHNSWKDYYSYYRFHNYLHHPHYYHHKRFGHVIKRFTIVPHVFYHNRHKYYCHDGYFYKYRRGIGYVLVDIPFGMVFNHLPHGYEIVYINGYMYFRVGNLFFERGWNGYRLVHFPERYYVNHDHYYNDYYYEDYYR